MESTVSRLSKGAKYSSFTAAEIASSTRWLRGMNAGLAARIAFRRSFASPPSSASRWRHLAAQSSKELGSVNRLRTPASPSGLVAASHSRRKIKVKSPRLEQAELAAEARGVRSLEAGGERVDCLLRLFDGSVLVLCKQRQERLRQAGEVPLGDAWLIAVSVTPHVINGAVDRPGVVDVHEGAGAVVDGLARYRHVVGVHDAMNEADE